LSKSEEGPFESQYVALNAPWNAEETPVEIARKLVGYETNLKFEFLGYSPSMPMLLDERSVKTYPPFHLQITAVDNETEYVDYVYLGYVTDENDIPAAGPLCWFNQATIKNAPNHVKHLVHHILVNMIY